MSAPRLSLVLSLLFASLFAAQSLAADEKEPALTARDKKYIDGLLTEFLFDPRGAERVAVKTVVRTVWAETEEATREGWLVPDKEGKPARVFFTDGASMPAPPEKEIKKVDVL